MPTTPVNNGADDRPAPKTIDDRGASCLRTTA
jgi:hypothetical protein